MTAPGTTATRTAPAAPHLVEVTFKGNRREFFTWAFPDPPALGTHVIVDADRGEDLGVVNATGDLAARRKAGTTHGKAAPTQLRAALRAATADDIARGAQLRADEDNVRRRAIEKVRAQQLELKVSDSEWQWDRKKLTIYFTAEKRVDFRQLVRQLEGLFGARVQMWHIGVRDEARRLDGIGRCARQFCSASWLPELRPVKSSIAKDQRLSTLNPAQISGTCGRLMCCLRYEHEFYVKQRKRFPKEGKIVVTLAGEERIVSNDIFREQVTLRNATGELRVMPLAQLNRELGGETAATESDLPGTDDESDVDEESAGGTRNEAPSRGRELRTYPGTVPPGARPPSPPSPPSLRSSPSSITPPPRPEPSSTSAPPPRAESQGGEGDSLHRRRRRGRRGGRRGREGGGPSGGGPSGGGPSGGGPSGGGPDRPQGTPPAPPAPPAGD